MNRCPGSPRNASVYRGGGFGALGLRIRGSGLRGGGGGGPGYGLGFGV